MEENKVAARDKLAGIIGQWSDRCDSLAIADLILQSPDLQVTLAEKRDFVSEMIKRTRYELCSTAEYRILDILGELNARLNSKEPK